MNKLLLISLLFVVVCVLESSCDTITEFFNDFSNAVTNAWQNMKTAMKRPVRIKRLGRGGKRNHLKRTTTATTTTTTTESTISSTYLMLKKLELPVLLTPKWRNLDEWKNLQRPRFALKSGGPSSRGNFWSL